MDHDQLKAQLMAKAEAAIDKLLASDNVHEQMSLTEIEEATSKVGQQIQHAVINEIAAVQEAPRVEACPTCGGKLRAKGRKKRQIVTRHGELHLQRPYSYCPACEAGIFPPGSTVRRHSPDSL